jgi:hypothetical protein
MAELESYLLGTSAYSRDEVDLGVGADFLAESGGGDGSVDGDLDVGLEAVAVEQTGGDAGALDFEILYDLPDGGARNVEGTPAPAQGAEEGRNEDDRHDQPRLQIPSITATGFIGRRRKRTPVAR